MCTLSALTLESRLRLYSRTIGVYLVNGCAHGNRLLVYTHSPSPKSRQVSSEPTGHLPLWCLQPDGAWQVSSRFD